MNNIPSKEDIENLEKFVKKMPVNYALLTIGYLLCVVNGSLFLGFILLKKYNLLTLANLIILVLNIISAESSRRTINYMLEVKRSLKLYYLFSKVNKGDGTND
jgi:hypothetical protein